MRAHTFTFGGRTYSFLADDGQEVPQAGQTIEDDRGRPVVWLTHDGQYWTATDEHGGYVQTHEDEPFAEWETVLACLAGY